MKKTIRSVSKLNHCDKHSWDSYSVTPKRGSVLLSPPWTIHRCNFHGQVLSITSVQNHEGPTKIMIHEAYSPNPHHSSHQYVPIQAARFDSANRVFWRSLNARVQVSAEFRNYPLAIFTCPICLVGLLRSGSKDQRSKLSSHSLDVWTHSWLPMSLSPVNSSTYCKLLLEEICWWLPLLSETRVSNHKFRCPARQSRNGIGCVLNLQLRHARKLWSLPLQFGLQENRFRASYGKEGKEPAFRFQAKIIQSSKLSRDWIKRLNSI